MESSSKVHVKPSGWLAIPMLPEGKTVNAEPFSVPGSPRAVQGEGAQVKFDR